MRKLIVPIVLLLSLCACSEKDASDIFLYVIPSSYSVSGGDKMYFEVTAVTIHDHVSEFEVATFDSKNGRQELFHAEPKVKEFTYRYEYVVPAMESKDVSIEVMFSATDNLGNMSDMTIKLNIRDGVVLDEMSGITLWSPASGKEDAFSFSSLEPVCSASAEDGQMDVYVMPVHDSDALGRVWGTKTGVKFVKANSFNYSSVTSVSLYAAYSTSVKADTAEDIAVDDIVIAGRESDVLGVFKVIQIYDEDGTLNDRYIVNFKPMPALTE